MNATWILASVLTLTATLLTEAADSPQSRPAAQAIEQRATSELIDDLLQVTNQEFSVRTNIIAGNPLPRGLLRLRDAPLGPDQTITELQRRGVDALPQLLAHLDDARDTKAVIQSPPSGFIYSAEYDWNSRSGHIAPKGVFILPTPVSRLKDAPPKSNEYTVTVGDLCFNIIGDIVNRKYKAIRYQPTAIVVINSPMLCPELRNAVRAEWAGFTAQQHRESLTRDVVMPDSLGHDVEGIMALRKYYPAAVAEAVHTRLKVPHYDVTAARAFVVSLHANNDQPSRVRMMNEYIDAEGSAARDGLVMQLWGDRSRPELAKELLHALMGDFSSDYPPPVTAVASASTGRFIEAIGTIESNEIASFVWEAFERESSSHAPLPAGNDLIACAAARYLVHKGHDGELTAYCNRRITEIGQPRQSSSFLTVIKLIGDQSGK